MNPELKQLLIMIAVCVPIGLLAGVLLRKTSPKACQSYTKFCLNRKWWFFLLGLLMFFALSVMSFVTDRSYNGYLFVAFAALQAFCPIKYGFKPLSTEWNRRLMLAIQLKYFRKHHQNK